MHGKRSARLATSYDAVCNTVYRAAQSHIVAIGRIFKLMANLADELTRVATALEDRFAVVRLLGRGGAASVYLATDKRLRRNVAIKVLRSGVASAIGADRFLREIELTAQLQHPHILGVIESGASEGLLYYVLPYVEGESLHDRLLRSRQLEVDEAVQITTEVADALAYAHAHGVIHRDIKPENVLLSGHHAIVTDFGLARALASGDGSRLTESGVTMGTPFYMSPEQAAGDQQLDGRTDQYALACVLYEMLAGEPPFSGATPQMVLARQVTQPPPPIRVVRQAVNKSVASVIERALQKSPADRYPGVAEFAAALRAAHFGLVAPASPRTSTRRTLLVVTVACLLAGGAWFAMRSGHPTAPDVSATAPLHVAVLGFNAPDGSTLLATLAAGVTTRLTDALSSTPALTVTSRRATAPYDGGTARIDSVARALGVGTLIDGSMMADSERVRVALRVLDESGRQIASTTISLARAGGSYPVNLLADSVTRTVRKLLGPAIRIRRQRLESHSADAFDDVQAAEERLATFQTQLSGQDMRAAERSLHDADSLFAAADQRDPQWVEPLLGRARVQYTYTQLAAVKSLPPDRWLRDGLAYAAKAVTSHPGNSGALQMRGAMSFELASKGNIDSTEARRLRENAEADLRASLNNAPDRSEALRRLSEVVASTGRTGEAIGLADSAYGSDPYLANSQNLILRLFEYNFELGRDSTAAAWCATGHQRFPDEASLLECQLQLMAWDPRAAPDVGRARQIVGATLATMPPLMQPVLSPRLELLVGLVHLKLGHADSARAIVTRVLAGTVRNVGIVVPAADILEILGDDAAAAQTIATFVAAHPAAAPFVRRSPGFAILARSPAVARAVAP